MSSIGDAGCSDQAAYNWLVDDDDGMTGEGSVNAMAKAGLTSGCAPRRFCPTRAITREQMAALLYRGLAH